MTNDLPDPFDADLQELFADVHPNGGFEDRLIHAVRLRQRWSIAAPIRRAAVAAAAVLVVGTVGYFGNMVIIGGAKSATADSRQPHAETIVSSRAAYSFRGSPSTSPSPAAIASDFGGGSNMAQNWVTWNGNSQPNLSYTYQNPFASNRAVANGFQLKKSEATFPIASDINPFIGTQHDNIFTSKDSKSSPVDNTDSILLPYAGASGDSDVSRKTPAPPTRAFMPTQISNGALASGKTDSSDVQFANAKSIVGKNRTGLSKVDETLKHLDRVEQTEATIRETTDSIEALKKAVQTSQADLNDSRRAEAAQLFTLSDGEPKSAAGEPAGGKGGRDAVGNSTLPARNTGALTTAAVIDTRKIIRSGTMEFEVDRFDAAQSQIIKIVGEAGGYVGTTDSTKLPNGKVRGTISLRVPPERLDTLVLSLRALGDLKSQQITAADITKEYTDLESELTADRAMQDRLLELIHGGKGSIKDLLAAENELGTWRGKIEKAEGQIRYYNGLIGMSTLSITLAERDIQTPATAVETETADIGIEAEDVERARNTAMKTIEDARGRIIEAELKRFDAGQLAATLTAEVPPDATGTVIDQLKLLGKVARLEVHRQETNGDGSADHLSLATTTSQELSNMKAAHKTQVDDFQRQVDSIKGSTQHGAAVAQLDDMQLDFRRRETLLQNRLIGTPTHLERKPTRLLISIYNLANVAPRRTTNISLAATDVEAAFNALIAQTKTDGGRVVTSSLDRGDPVKATGAISLEIPPAIIEAAMAALRAQGQVLKLSLTENADTQNSTEAKQGLMVQLVSLASVPPRETVQQSIAAVDVPAAYQAILNSASSARARVLTAQLNEQDRHNISADVQLEVLRSELPALDKAVAASGDTISRTSSRAADAGETVDSKVQLRLAIGSADHLASRETTKLRSEVTDVDKSAGDAQAAALALGGRVLEATITDDHGKGTARVAVDVPLDKSQELLRQIRQLGIIRGIDASRDTQAPTGPLAHAQIFVEFTTGDTIVTADTGPWASVRHGLSTSIGALLWSLQWVVVGLCLIGPFAVIFWITAKVLRRLRSHRRAEG